MTLRLFAGIALDATARQRCAEIAGELRRGGFDARYEAPEKYHITIAFLGNVRAEQLEPVEGVLHSLSHRSAFRIVLDRLGGFPHERRPRVVFVGARSQGTAFADLAIQTRKLYASRGFPLDKDPVAHVTIGRVNAPKRPLPLIEVEAIRIEISTLTLFESLPDPPHNTSRYEIRSSVMLRPATPK